MKILAIFRVNVHYPMRATYKDIYYLQLTMITISQCLFQFYEHIVTIGFTAIIILSNLSNN